MLGIRRETWEDWVWILLLGVIPSSFQILISAATWLESVLMGLGGSVVVFVLITLVNNE